MACASCAGKPVTPYVRDGLPTIWSWVQPTPDLVAVPTEDALAIVERMNGKVN